MEFNDIKLAENVLEIKAFDILAAHRLQSVLSSPQVEKSRLVTTYYKIEVESTKETHPGTSLWTFTPSRAERRRAVWARIGLWRIAWIGRLDPSSTGETCSGNYHELSL